MTVQTITTDVNILQRMAAAGIPFQDAHWYYCVARPRGFLRPAEMVRACSILRLVAQASAR